MARTGFRTVPPPGHTATAASLGPPTPTVRRFDAFTPLHLVTLEQLAGDEPGSELIMMPEEYEDRDDVDEDAEWRKGDHAPNCWVTTLIYQHIDHHPNLVRFLRPDPWTWLPVFANPGGPHLSAFLGANRAEMYEQRSGGSTDNKTTACARVRRTRLNLVYQWALHLAKALEHIHSYAFDMTPVPKITIIFGDLDLEKCFLSPSGTTLSLLGFVNSGYRTRSSALHLGNFLYGYGFRPLPRDVTLQTDLFLWGSVVYELMTGHYPGNGQGLEYKDKSTMVPRREWPSLEAMYLGDVVRKCWAGDITSAAELVVAVRKAVTDLGVVLGEDDVIEDLSLALEGLNLRPDPIQMQN